MVLFESFSYEIASVYTTWFLMDLQKLQHKRLNKGFKQKMATVFARFINF